MPTHPRLRCLILNVVIFTTGASVLAIEIVATRILAPYFGTTIFTVTSVISVIMGALGVGYYFGGWLADRRDSLVQFYMIILLGGITVLGLEFIVTVYLKDWAYHFSIVEGPLYMSLVLFFLPAFLLGLLVPYAVRLQHDWLRDGGAGRIAGSVFFWSTAGSIAGCLVAGYFLIPNFGVDRIVAGIGYLLLAIGTLGVMITGRKKKSALLVSLVIALITFICFEIMWGRRPSNVIVRQDGVYQRIEVSDHKSDERPVRLLMQDLNSNSGMYLDTGEMLFDYTKYYAIYKIFVPELKRALAIGGGAYSVPKHLLAELPGVQIDVVEIEPALHQLAQQYFQLPDDPRLTNHTEDGRRFLHETQHQYQLIFSDVYYSLSSVPMHCNTQEFFALAQSKLSPEGIFVGNFIGSQDPADSRYILSILRTFLTVFPNYYVFVPKDVEATEPQNFLLVGHNSSKRINLKRGDILRHKDPIIRELHTKQVSLEEYDLEQYTLLTDNYAPVESLMAPLLKNFAQQLRRGVQ